MLEKKNWNNFETFNFQEISTFLKLKIRSSDMWLLFLPHFRDGIDSLAKLQQTQLAK